MEKAASDKKDDFAKELQSSITSKLNSYMIQKGQERALEELAGFHYMTSSKLKEIFVKWNVLVVYLRQEFILHFAEMPKPSLMWILSLKKKINKFFYIEIHGKSHIVYYIMGF